MKKISVKKGIYSFFVDDRTLQHFDWNQVTDNKWEPYTFEIFNKYADKTKTCLDIGSWIGPTVLYGAHLFKHIYAFEPDPVAFNELKLNIEANNFKNITYEQLAINDVDGVAEICGRGDLGRSYSSLVTQNNGQTKKCKCAKLISYITSHNIDISDIGFIKMDVEGAEVKIIPNIISLLKEHRIPLYISLHPHIIDVRNCLGDLVDNSSRRYDINLREISKKQAKRIRRKHELIFEF